MKEKKELLIFNQLFSSLINERFDRKILTMRSKMFHHTAYGLKMIMMKIQMIAENLVQLVGNYLLVMQIESYGQFQDGVNLKDKDQPLVELGGHEKFHFLLVDLYL